MPQTSLATLLVLADGRLPAGGHAHSGGLEAAVAAGRVTDLAGLAGFLRGRLATSGVVGAVFAAAACARTREWADLDAGLDARTPSPALRRASRAQGRALLRAGRAIWPAPPLLPASPGRALPDAAMSRPGGQATRGDATSPSPPGDLASPGAAIRPSPPGDPASPGTAMRPSPAEGPASPGAAMRPSPAEGPASPGAAMSAASLGIAPHHPVALGLVAAAAGLRPREAAVAAAHGTLTGPASAAVRLLGLDPYGVHALLAELAGVCDRIADDAHARADDPVDALPASGAPLLDIGAEFHATWEVRLFAS
ncbi:urease accessory protein [Krasilnikovia cinnamomea]|uniref:Urease accessory protein UreF n=1 Tax=Krasilnikovia cinnamomea TaxID=349313 RepID=A0A4Q7ZFU2_9ACTN|nr:urease accessory UreF family protein [Krasilnikovia cinnamomea]RZU48985.1 urease accessory protein [Krasilnikovia cinnamomea]